MTKTSIRMLRVALLFLLALTPGKKLKADESELHSAVWRMHTVDRQSKGADGVRLGDVDKDGELDVVTGWEEGGRIRICFQPKLTQIHNQWPAIVVGKVKSPEDAVFVDVNRDGWLDVVSCCEGKQQTVFAHLNPAMPQLIRKASAWKTRAFSSTTQLSRWMYGQPLNDRQLVLGSKQPNGQISLLNMDADNSSAALRQLRPSGWIMSLRTFDIDHDGDLDIVYSDRKGPDCQVGWLENMGDDKWADHEIGGAGLEVMFLDIATVNHKTVIACNTRNQHIMLLTPTTDVRAAWKVRRVSHPPNSGAGKAVAIGDLNGNGQFDLACTCGLASGKFGVYWLSDAGDVVKETGTEQWQFHDISGTKVGVKFDRIELMDIDQDGDLDLLTCEERDNLGVIWYENPQIKNDDRAPR